MKKIKILSLVLVALVFACSCEDNTGEFVEYAFNNAQKSVAISDCLNSSVDTACAHLFKTDGFYGNADYKMTFNPLDATVFATLNDHGFGYLADSLVLTTNRMVESCNSVVNSIFKNTIKDLQVVDYDGIIKGDSVAITDYFAMMKYSALTDSLKSPIGIRMEVFQVNSIWSEILTRYNEYSTSSVNFDVKTYVIDNVIESVLSEMRKEEVLVRADTNHQNENTALFRYLK